MARSTESEDLQESAQDAAAARAAADAFRVSLPPRREGEPPFEGPLDLILHLVKEHEIDLFDIPIARITEGYLTTLEALRELDIDLAGEFLHMAAQLVLMKSKLLLPRTEVAEDAGGPEDLGSDPRAELVKRLLEYQKYKLAGEDLGARDILDRTVFARRARIERIAADGPEGLADVSVFKLIEALAKALEHAKLESVHTVEVERLGIGDAIAWVAEFLRTRRRATFEELLCGPADQPHGRAAIISTFLAILEMAKLRLIRVYQTGRDEEGPGAEILVEARETLGDDVPGSQEDYR